MYREKLTKKGYPYRSGWKGRSGGGTGKSEFRDKSEDKCFKCGETGHWASKCKGSNICLNNELLLVRNTALHVSGHIFIYRKGLFMLLIYYFIYITQVELPTS